MTAGQHASFSVHAGPKPDTHDPGEASWRTLYVPRKTDETLAELRHRVPPPNRNPGASRSA